MPSTPTPTPTGIQAVDTAAALVTVALEEPLDRHLLTYLVRQADEEGYLYELTAALALGFAANVEGIATLVGGDPHELWRTWCQREAGSRTLHGLARRRPFNRGERS